jgi:hypothetical protein
MENKFYFEGKINLQEETKHLKEKASKIIELPSDKDKQPDLMYFSAILVSSGENLNHAYFMGSELVAAEETIIHKALDIEHAEQDIIGHIYERAYMDKDGNPLDIKELSTKETASLDSQDMHIAIAGIIYKDRFPNLSKEIANSEWNSVSMECYFQHYDVKIGDLILSRQEAEALGLAANNDNLGRVAKVIKNGKEIAKGTLARVLRKICFSGCGIVKNPANPDSIVLEVASKDLDDVIILNYDSIKSSEEENKVTSVNTEQPEIKEIATDGNLDDSTGICVGFKRRLLDKANKIVAENWCVLYNKSCTSFSRDTTDPNCLRTKEMVSTAKMYIEDLLQQKAAIDKREDLLSKLKTALNAANRIQLK